MPKLLSSTGGNLHRDTCKGRPLVALRALNISYAAPRPVLQLLLPNTQVPNSWVHGPSGRIVMKATCSPTPRWREHWSEDKVKGLEWALNPGSLGAYIYKDTKIYTYVFICVYLHTTHMCVYVYNYTPVYLYVYIYIYICVHLVEYYYSISLQAAWDRT